MKGHLTQEQLIRYQFELVSDNGQQIIAEHLQDCSACREDLERLRRKFSLLDLLREEVMASEQLISQVVEQAGSAQSPVRARVLPIRVSAWIASAAAVLLAGVFLLVGHLNEQQLPVPELVRGPAEPVEKTSDFAWKETALTEVPAEQVPVKEPLTLAVKAGKTDRPVAVGAISVPAGPASAQGGSFGHRISGLGLAGERQAPFAPGSAIELVVLPRRDSVQITIYNSADLTLVRERRNLTLKKGWNWLQFMWANTLIDPTSLSLEPLQEADKIDVQQLVFPARLRELGRWLIRSEVGGRVPFEITYFTSGLSWRAFYMGTLSQDEKTMRLDGYVRVGNNSGEDYENAQTRLIVGKVHLLDQIAELAKRQYPYGSPMHIQTKYDLAGAEYNGEVKKVPVLADMPIVGGLFKGMGLKEIRKEGLSEYFLYTIEGTETIPDKWGKRLLSFEAEDIPVKSLYKYDEERWGEQTIRFVSFANDEEHELGDTPIPNGTVRIYGQADEQGYLSYVGGTDIKYIPVNEEVELNLGPARLAEVKPILMDFKTDNYVFDKKKNISGWDEIRTWKMEVTSTRTLSIEIEITRGFGTAYWTLAFAEKDVSYEKHDATHARFKLELEPRTKRAFEYTVTTYHGAREEVLTK
jgi:hypothetical protein